MNRQDRIFHLRQEAMQREAEYNFTLAYKLRREADRLEQANQENCTDKPD